MLFTLILVIHVLVCLVLVASILVQQGKGASMGAAFGTAGSQTVFGSAGAGNFLTKTTSFSSSLLLAYRSSFRRSVVADITPPADTVPAAPEGAMPPKPEGKSEEKPSGAGATEAKTPAAPAPAAPKAAAPIPSPAATPSPAPKK